MWKNLQKSIFGFPNTAKYFLINIGVRSFIYLAWVMPYRLRVWFFGAVFSACVGILTSRLNRAKKNVRLVYPAMAQREVNRIAWACLNNFGRTIIEIFSAHNFCKRTAEWTMSGSGLEALEQANKDGRAVILITGHFANFSATGTYLTQKGFDVASLYRPLNNRFLNGIYQRSIELLVKKNFARKRNDFRKMHNHLKNKGILLIIADQYIDRGENLFFLGKPTMTTLSPAKLALKFDALLVPNYAIRAKDGINFELIFEAPIPPSNPCDMMQLFNDSLARRIEQNPEQWLWTHNRWKPHRDAKRLAALTGPKPAS